MAFLLDVGRASMWAVNAIVSSATGGKVGHQEVPPKVVLVPPLFERDLRLRSRSECLQHPTSEVLASNVVVAGARLVLRSTRAIEPISAPRFSVKIACQLKRNH